MKFARDFKAIALDALTGKWFIAVAVGFVASVLGGGEGGGPEVNINFDANNTSADFSFAGQTVYSTADGINPELFGAWIFSALGILFAVGLVIAAVYLVLGSFVSVGYAKFNLNLVDKAEAGFENLFEYFSYWKTTAAARLLKLLYVFLWSLLFIIPGIVAGYSYAMTEYLLAENPNMSASEAIERSKALMYGNRMRLFCLQLSFIGWSILAALTFGIGNLWLIPYKQAAIAAFYREISAEESVSGE